MQKIFSREQMQRCDAHTIANEPVASILLMERAACALFEVIINDYNNLKYHIYCGQGNNGGDGLALARLLTSAGKNIEVFVIKEKESGSVDFEINLERLKALSGVKLHEIRSKDDFPQSSDEAYIIDALLGTGMKGIARGLTKEAIDFINALPNIKIAVDVPSGLPCDESFASNSSIVYATVTLSFQLMKLAFLLPESQQYCGKVKLLDIGLHANFIKEESTKYYLTDSNDVRDLLVPRKRFAHKGNFGHALIISGSEGKHGAALLSAKACARSGVGLVTVHSVKALQPALNVYLPSAMFNASSNDTCISDLPDLETYEVIAAGCGIGKSAATQSMLKLLIQQCKVPLLLDADAINILADNKTWLSFLPAGSMLTPHPKEFERLCGKWSNSFERMKMQKDFSIKYNCFVLLKGAYTCITTPLGNYYFNPTGNPGMAKGGSGDALTGVILALLAQGLNQTEACIAGAYIHGLAGDLAAEKFGHRGMLPEDLIDELGNAIKLIESMHVAQVSDKGTSTLNSSTGWIEKKM